MTRGSPGGFELLVLLALIRVGDDAYGVSIFRRAQELVAPRTVSLGAVYVTLDRMEDKGYLTSWLSDPTPQRGGRAKRRYKLQASGEAALQDSAATARRMFDAIARALGPGWLTVRN